MGNRIEGRPHFSIYRDSALPANASSEVILARAFWQDKMNSTGWNFLRVDIDKFVDVPDNHKSYAAGLLEGYLTHSRIRDFFLNTRQMIASQKGGKDAILPVREVFEESISRVQDMGVWDPDSPLNSRDLDEPVDQLVRLALFQIWGLSDGYEAVRHQFHPKELSTAWPKIDLVDMHFLSADGDFPDLKDATNPDAGEDTPRRRRREETHHALEDKSVGSRQSDLTFLQTENHNNADSPARDMYVGTRRRQYGRCSALVRLAEDNSNLFVGHSTWEPFSEMTRILKYYDFPFKNVASRRLAFPSYPGAITSTDDFILTSSGLVLTETTIDIRDRSLFRKRSNIDDDGGRYSDFMKPLVAARLAKSGAAWVDIFSESADAFLGIASCQWMVIDYNKFNGKSRSMDNEGVLFVLEGIPGLIHSQDMTRRLVRNGYWGSANRAWFRDVRDILGDDDREDADKAMLSTFSKDDNPRAFTFSHLAPEVDSIQDMERLMQFSPVSFKKGGPPAGVAIAPRFDLSSKKMTPEGATDSKIVDASLIKDLAFIGISGPEHQRHDAFSWTDGKGRNKFDANLWPHHGMPSVWNFTWQMISSSGMRPLSTTPMLVQSDGEIREWSDKLKEAYDRRVFEDKKDRREARNAFE